MADLPPPPYAAVSPKSLPRLEALPYEVLVRILQLSTTRYVHPTDRHAAVWWLVREVRLVSRTLRDVIQSYLRTALYSIYLAEVRPPFKTSISPPLSRTAPVSTSSRRDAAAFFAAQGSLHELAVLDSFIAAFAHAQAVRSESDLMLEGDDDWKLEVFTLRQPQARLLDLLLVHPSLPALWPSTPSELTLSFTPRRLTLWRLQPSGRPGPKVELGSFNRSKGEGEDLLLERLLSILREGRRCA